MKLIPLTLLLTICLCANAQDIDPKNQPPKTFSLNPNDLGALENSVNLFTGQVSFPMNIASTPGRGGLSAAVTLLYNSNVQQSIGKWNLEYPTSTVGLGWSLEIPKIICNNKLTGARADDEFFLLEGGQAKKLVCKNSASSPRIYEVKSPDFWKVEYYWLEERWVVTKENGMKFTFGGQNSGRNTVQWIVRWSNWIGSSTLPTGQQQQAFIWNLADIENSWGEKMLFEYDNVEEFVARNATTITTHRKHTKASYIKRITDPAGYTIEFLYDEKLYGSQSTDKREYQDPHAEQAEPDAYQEKYETRFLDRLIVKHFDGSLLYETDLEYTTDLIGSGDQVKRVLTSIKSLYPSGQALPPVKFDYFDSGDFVGSMKRVTNAYGAYYDYTYTRSQVPMASLDITVDAPTPGQWKEHYVFPGNDYVVVVWRTVNADGSHNSDWRPCRIFVYTWDGQWTKQDLTANVPGGSIPLKTRADDENNRVLDFQIVLGDYFFSYLYQRQDLTSQYEGKIWHRKESTGTTWQLQSVGTGDDSPVLFSGDHFIGISQLRSPIIKTFVFNGDWINFLDVDASNQEAEYFLNAANNYIFVHNDNGGNQDYIHVVHLSEEKKWVKTSAPSTQLFRTDGDGFRLSFWHSFNSFSMGLPWDNEEFIYQWNDSYTGIHRTGGWGRIPDNSLVYSRGNSMLSTIPRQDDRTFGSPGFDVIDLHSARFNGSSWLFNPLYGTATFKNIGAGNDFTIHDVWPSYSPRRAFLQEYDPNLGAWKTMVEYNHGSTYLNTKDGENKNLAIEAGPDSFIIGDGDYYTRNVYGQWSNSAKLKLGSGEYLVGKSLIITPTFIAYEYSNSKTGNPSGSYIAYLKNGKIDRTERYSSHDFDSKPIHLGTNIIAHVQSDTKLVLRKVIEGRAHGASYVNHVRKLNWYDGNKTFVNSYDYDLATAKVDPSGTLAYFNKVGVIQGSPNTTQRPFGHKDVYFFNGLSANALAAKPVDPFSQAVNVGVGEIYQTDFIDAASDTIAFTKTELKVFTKTIKNGDNKTVDVDYYVRPTKNIQMQDEVLTEVFNTFQPETGLLDYSYTTNSKRKQRYTSGSSSAWYDIGDTRTRYMTYWWEVYDPQRTGSTWLSDVVQITDTYNSLTFSDTTSSVVTRWKTWENGKKAPDNTYGWLRTNTVAFNAWSAPATPDPAHWKTANEVVKRDLVTGFPLEVKSSSGLTEAYLFDDSRTQVIARAVNSTFDQMAFTSFERGAKGRWIFNDSACAVTDSAFSGLRIFHGNYAIESPGMAAGQYELSLWARGAAPQVSLNAATLISSKSYTSPRGWTLFLYRVEFQNGGRVTIQSADDLDEVRLHPVHSKITTYTFNRFGSLLSEDGPDHVLAHFAYDEMNRPTLIKDHKLFIRKRFEYRYRDEEENLSTLITYSDTLQSGQSVWLEAKHPAYFADTASYEWDFGDGVKIVSESARVTHVYSTAGSYRVSVRVVYKNNPEAFIRDEKPLRIPENLAVKAMITSGSTQVVSCPSYPNTSVTQFAATIISSTCQVLSYTWYIVDEGGTPVEFATGSTAGYTFTTPGSYQVYCRVTNCNESVNTSFIGITVNGDNEHCGTEEQN